MSGGGSARRARAYLPAPALILYLGAVLVITLTPSPVDRPYAGLLERVLRALHARGVPQAIDYRVVESSANVLFFVPVGALLALLLPRPRQWLALVAAVLLSATVELCQAMFLPLRTASLSDLLANSLGAAVGLGMVLVRQALSRSRQRRIRDRPGEKPFLLR